MLTKGSVFRNVIIKILNIFLVLFAITLVLINWVPSVINKVFNYMAMLGLSRRFGINVPVQDVADAVIAWGIPIVLMMIFILTRKRLHLESQIIFWIIVMSIIVVQVIVFIV